MDMKMVVVGPVGIQVEKEVEGAAMVDGTPYLSQRGPLRPRFGLAGIARCGSGRWRLCSRISGSSRYPHTMQRSMHNRPSRVSSRSVRSSP
jgi:hypothetical protein